MSFETTDNNKAAVAPFTLKQSNMLGPRSQGQISHPQIVAGGRGVLVTGLLSAEEAEHLRAEARAQSWQPVGLDGIASHYRDGDPVGSWRATSDEPRLSAELFARLRGSGALALLGPITPETPTDHGGRTDWEPGGVNPRLRFIRYEGGARGLLLPHHDGPYHGPDGSVTLVTVVLYLGKTGAVMGGATRFIHDPQDALPLQERDHSDWTREATEEEVIERIDPPAGSALLFWHRVLHDSEPVVGSGEKMIIRTDVTFRHP